MRLIDRALLGHSLPFFVAVTLSLVARVQTVASPLYSGDTYAVQWSAGFDYGLMLSQGRFGQALLEWLRDLVGFGGSEVSASALILAVLLFAHSGLLLAHVVLRKPTAAEVTIFVVLFTIHPFNTEFFFFSDATLDIAVSLWLTSAAMYLSSTMGRPLLAAVVGVIMLAFALAIYQTAIVVALAIAILALVARLANLDVPRGESLLRSREVRLTLATIASVPVYLLWARLAAWITGVSSDARTSIAGLLGNPWAKLEMMAEATRLALWPMPGLISHLDSALLILLLLLSSAALLWPLLRDRRWFVAFTTVVLLTAALMWSAGASALSDVYWLVPRTLVGICAFAAGLVMIGWRVRPGKVWRAALAVGLVILIIGYVGASNRILFDQRLLNRWDMQEATRILARLETDPGYADLHALAIIGGRWGYPAALPTMVGDMNVSALAISWAKLGLFQLATGYRFSSPTEGETADAQELCEAVEPWPAAGSIMVREGVGIVCLPQQ